MAMHDGRVDLTAHCLCKAHIFHGSVSGDALPLSGRICHCTACRHVTGALHASTAPWPGSPEDIEGSSLRRYKFSDVVQMLFCPKCSSLLFREISEKDQTR